MVEILGGDLTVDAEDYSAWKAAYNLPPRRMQFLASKELQLREKAPVVKTFHIGSTEISRRQLESVMRKFYGGDGYLLQDVKFQLLQINNLDAPVTRMRFCDAAVFCNALSTLYGLPEYYQFTLSTRPQEDDVHVGIEGWLVPYRIEVPDNEGAGFRLPTVWEWEYACRSGSRTAFHFGDDPNSICEFGCNAKCDDEHGRTLRNPVRCASFKPNAWGLYDMHGNVWEWTMGNLDGNRLSSRQYLKGGSVNATLFECRSSHINEQYTGESEMGGIGFGFRIARND